MASGPRNLDYLLGRQKIARVMQPCCQEEQDQGQLWDRDPQTNFSNSRWLVFPVPSFGISCRNFTSRGTAMFGSPLALTAPRTSSSDSFDSLETAMSFSPLSSSGRAMTATWQRNP